MHNNLVDMYNLIVLTTGILYSILSSYFSYKSFTSVEQLIVHERVISCQIIRHFEKKKFQDFLMTSRRETEGKIGRP